MRGSLRTAGGRPPGRPSGGAGSADRILNAASLRRRAAAARALLDASHPGPVAGVTAAASGYAAAVGRGTHGIVVVGLAVLAGQLTIGWQNDATDAPRDLAVGRDDKPIATGAVRRSVVARAAVVTAVATVPLSLASGWRAGTVHLVAVASAAAYNAGLKSGPLSIVPYLVSFGLLPAFVTLGAKGAPLPPWWVVTATACLGGAAHFLNVAPDRAADLETGVRSLPHRFTPKTNAFAATALALVSSTLLAFGAGSSSAVRIAGFALTACLSVYGAAAAAGGSRNGFRAIVLVAVADVGLLLLTAR